MSASSNVADDANGAAAVIELRPSVVSEINGAGVGGRCGTAGGNCGFNGDFAKVDTAEEGVTLVVEEGVSPDKGRFGKEFVGVEFEVVGVLVDTGVESRYEGTGGGDDVIGRETDGV